jgi:hypothetical protein
MAVMAVLVSYFALTSTGGYLSSPANGAEPPDNRVYEMVTPVDNDNADIYVPRALGTLPEHFGEVDTKLPFQVAFDGEAVAYVGDPTVGGTGNSGLGEGNEYISRHRSTGGWEPPEIIQPLNVNSAFYQAFSPDLTAGILEAGWNREPEVAPLSPWAPGNGYAELYVREFSQTKYEPFFTVTPPDRTPQEFGTALVPTIYAVTPELAYAGASSNFSRLLFEANDALTANATNGGIENNNLYMSLHGHVMLVNGGSTSSSATFGAPAFSGPKHNEPDFSNVISEDGSKVFWSSLDGTSISGLYVTEDSGVSQQLRTTQIDASQVVGGTGGGGRYWTSIGNGSLVFFTDSATAKLTSSTQSESGSNLYLYIVATRQVIDLTADDHAEVEGVLGGGENQSNEYTVYFVAKGLLSEEPNSSGGVARQGEDNLYMLREGHKPVFIATLSAEDNGDDRTNDNTKAIPLEYSETMKIGDWQPGLGQRTSQVTPEGNAVVFMSDNQDVEGHSEVVEGHRLEEVYVFESEGSEHGTLFCASCSRDGVMGQANGYSGEGLGAYIPISWSKTNILQAISDDGSRVFFNSDEPLVPEDTNGEQDVYEWEREGAGGCDVGGGCTYLLSGGTGETSSWLIGSSASGNDVFFVTRAHLSPTDTDEAYNLYDARVDGAQPVLSPACMGTGCQGLPSPSPVFAIPASNTFTGPSSLVKQSANEHVKKYRKSNKTKQKHRKRRRSTAVMRRTSTPRRARGGVKR